MVDNVKCRDCKHCSNIKKSNHGIYDVNDCNIKGAHNWYTDNKKDCSSFKAKAPVCPEDCKDYEMEFEDPTCVHWDCLTEACDKPEPEPQPAPTRKKGCYNCRFDGYEGKNYVCELLRRKITKIGDCGNEFKKWEARACQNCLHYDLNKKRCIRNEI